MKQLPLAIAPETAPGFDNYVSAGNEAVVAHLRSLRPGREAAPAYLWGPRGAGKTHLLTSWLAVCRADGVDGAVFGPATPLPWTTGSDARAIAIDDADQLDAARQHAAFTLFVEAATSGSVVVAAGLLPAVDLTVREDLRTRLGWGPSFALNPLDDDGVRDALSAEAGRRGLALSPEVLAYLQTRLSRDMSSLMRLLKRLDGYSLASGRAVTVPLLKSMLADEQAPEPAERAGA